MTGGLNMNAKKLFNSNANLQTIIQTKYENDEDDITGVQTTHKDFHTVKKKPTYEMKLHLDSSKSVKGYQNDVPTSVWDKFVNYKMALLNSKR
ncbi:hypothetical protein pdam_00022770 [Pocillopora damicornis]|uniref:Uncharacterized protein n=1 Tax=Pocillopora damicornis TaxID=46731 RepID=A0A3M6UN44_POCDA|nr:hypothetical protein pdam_00022770 [Pocillopora damicornis]